MCLIAFAWQQIDGCPLLVVANRDEQHARPTKPLHEWPDGSGIVAGQDLKDGGTWLGIHPCGRFAALTNVRSGMPDPAKLSRGALAQSYLQSQLSPQEYATSVESELDKYNGFNLLLGSLQQLCWVSNRGETRSGLFEPGVFAISNGGIFSQWPKVEYSKERLKISVESNLISDNDDLFEIMARRETFPDQQLPDTGVGIQAERWLSPPFIQSAAYGTRCSSIVRMRDDTIQLIERRYDADGDMIGEDQGIYDYQAH